MFCVVSVLITLALLLAACATPTVAPTTAPAATTAAPAAPAATTAAPAATTAAAPAQATIDPALVTAAKAEGNLTVIALPHDWCNYGEALSTFSSEYGIKINELNPDGASADEIQAIIANKDNKGPQAPDVIDVGYGSTPQLIADKLVQPYKVSTWDSIPDSTKDPNGYWYGDYYGVLAFEVNSDVVKNVPQDWSDLLNAEYKGQFALSGDPRASAQAQFSVIAASVYNGGSLDDMTAGLAFFKKVNDAGNFVPVIAKQATVAKGETPVILRWDYNALADKDSLAGNPNIAVVYPKSGTIAGIYVQAISAYAPHPNAAKLWEEFLYSDAGQNIWLKGYCHPIRYQDMKTRGVIPADLAAKLPAFDGPVAFPTLDQINAANKAIAANWMSVVGADVK
jgi:ABC-type Fe3+ transport system, periplasmic component